MENQYTAESLKLMIKELEIKQEEEGNILKEQIISTYENLKPANIIKNVIRDFFSTDSLKDELISTAVSVASGFITKRMLVGKSNNQLMRLVGLAVQFGITTLLSKKMDAIKEKIFNFINRFVEEKSEGEDPQVDEVTSV